MPKREIRLSRWEDKRDGIVYDIHRYSDGTSRYEQVGRLRGSARRERKRSEGSSKTKTTSPSQKGNNLENLVFQKVQHTIDGRLFVGRNLPVMGSAGDWEADITVSEPGDFDPKKMSGSLGRERAVIECKYSGTNVSPGSYVTGLARAYMHLNDIRLKRKDIRLFLVVNRMPKKGESPRDCEALLEGIGVGFVNLEDPSKERRFRAEIGSL